MSPRWFFGAFFGQASFAYFFFIVLGSLISKSIISWSFCGVLNWTCVEMGFEVISISGAGFGRVGNSFEEYEPKESSMLSVDGSLEVEGRPEYKLGAEIIGWCKICLCSTCVAVGNENDWLPPSNRIRFEVTGSTVDCTIFLNFPMESSMSSGLITISSSLKCTRFRLTPFFATKFSLIPNVEILRLWAVLYSVKFCKIII